MMLELLTMLGNAPATTLPAEYVGRITASDAETGEFFGRSLALSSTGAYFVVGAFADDDAGAGSGAIYIYLKVGSNYVQQQKIQSPVAGINFGYSIGINSTGDRIIVGHQSVTNPVYVYSRSGVTWSLLHTLNPSVTGGNYGASVALNGDGTRYAVGAPLQTSGGQAAAGAVFIFFGATETGRYSKTGPVAQEQLGATVKYSRDNTHIIATGSRDGGNVLFHAVVFFDSGSGIAQQAVLGNTLVTRRATCAINAAGDRAFIMDGNYTNGTNNGRILVYERSGINWVSVAQLLIAPPRSLGSGGNFVCELGCNAAGDLLVAAGQSTDRYEIAIFRRIAITDWMLQGFAQSRDALTSSSEISAAMASDGKTAAIGVWGYDAGPGGTNGGAAWVWTSTDNL